MKKSFRKSILKGQLVCINLPVSIVSVIFAKYALNISGRGLLIWMLAFISMQYAIYAMIKPFFKKAFDVSYMHNHELLSASKDTQFASVGVERFAQLYTSLSFSEQVMTQIQKDIDLLTQENADLKRNIEGVIDSSKQLDRAFRIEADTISSLVQSVPQLIIVFDQQGKLIEWNEAFKRRYGLSNQDLNKLNVSTMFTSEITEKTILEQLKKATDHSVFLTLSIVKDKDILKEGISFRVVSEENQRFTAIGKVTNEDIAMQAKILRKNRELEYINQINSSLISNWDIDELLDNIMKRMDSLFDISFGCLYVLDDASKWELKKSTLNKMSQDQLRSLNITHYFSSEWQKNSTVQTIDMRLADQVHVDYLVIAPLEIDGKAIAAMAIGIHHELSNSDENLLKMFNHQAAMVVQRAILYEQLRKQYLNTIEALVNVIEAKDKYTEGHSRRVSRFAVEIAKKMRYSNEDIENVEISGLLHDVGKIGIHQSILTKEGKLTNEEYEIMKEHPLKGIQVLESIGLNNKIRDGILYHHLRYDLKGYPKADHELKSLPEFAAIIGAADAFDAITSARSYSKARSVEEAIGELEKHEGTQFSPSMVHIFKTLVEEDYQTIIEIIEDKM